MQNILFGLREESVDFEKMEVSGSEISIYEDGTIQYDRFIFHSEEPVFSVKVKKGLIFAKEIQKVLTKYKKDIDRIPYCIANRTCDGSCYTFTFYDKSISIDNPSRYKEEGIIPVPPYGAAYIPLYDENEIFLPYYNNTLLDIQDEISAILARYDLPLLKYE